MFEQARFEDETVRLDPGDVLVVFSDGITDALNSDGEEFGEDKLVASVENHRDLEPAAVLDCVLDAVRRFSAAAAQNDDFTDLVLRYTGT